MSITAENLCFAYGGRPVLKDVGFSAHSGELLAVLGPNGVGKSTLFRCILGVLPKYTGKIYLDGTDARSLTARELAHRVAYIPQSHGQTFHYSVLDMVLMGTSHRMGLFASPGKKEVEAAMAALARLGIEDLTERSFSRLSGGEQQLVLIARALAQEAEIFLMDEPTSSLDYGNQSHVLSQVRALTREGYTVLLSTHTPQHALWYADTALALLDGGVAACGPAGEVVTPELIYHLYGVEVEFVPARGGSVIAPPLKGRER